MKTLTLGAFKKEIQVADGIDYRYDGEISSPILWEAGVHYKEGSKILAGIYLASGILRKIGIRGVIPVNGFCTGFHDFKTGKTLIRTAVRGGFTPVASTYAWGHEETHVSEYVTNSTRFLEDMLEERNLDCELQEGRENLGECDWEYKANIGGQLAVLTHHDKKSLDDLKRYFESTGFFIPELILRR